LKAIIFDHHGGPEVLRYADAPEPELRSGEVLVRVHACALNHLDLWVREGIPGVPFPLPHIPGSDIAGVVAKIGPERNHHQAQPKSLASSRSKLRKMPCMSGGK